MKSLITSLAAQFLRTSQALPLHTQTQLIDPSQLQRLTAMLSRRDSDALPKHRTPLPAGYHLAYFTPAQENGELGRDGTDTTFNAPFPYTRRMWAGGELRWVGGREGRMAVGDEVRETTRMVSCVVKEGRGGEGMLVVGVEKRFGVEGGRPSLVDTRNWIFRQQIEQPQPPVERPQSMPFPDAKCYRDFTQTPVTLFRFSALTFNAHKIHYNKEWCRDVEGHRDLVVHGPLNLINMLNLWRDSRTEDALPKRIKYRMTSPLYVEERYRVILDEEEDKVSLGKIVDSFGKVAMVAEIESF